MSRDRQAREKLLPTLVGEGVLGLTGQGEVVSVFARAVNVRHVHGLIVSFIKDTRDMTSLSVCVPDLFRNHRTAPFSGDRVRFEGCRLVTEGFDMDLSGQPAWSGTLSWKDVEGFHASKVPLLEEALLLKGIEGGFLGLLGGGKADTPFLSRAKDVLWPVRSSSPRAEWIKALSGLIGLGPGSTPSGDDFVAGALMGEEALTLLGAVNPKAVAEGQDAVIPWAKGKEDLRACVSRTNDAGKTLLLQALEGHFPNYLIEALRSVSAAKGKQEIVDAVDKAVGRGATSGTDALTGLVFSVSGRIQNP